MNRVQPFRGWRYDLQKAGAASLNELVTPPYDVISGQQQAAFYARNPHNVIRIDLARDLPGDDDRTNRYRRAAETLANWQASGILLQEPEPAIYLLRERYPTADGGQGVRTGVIFRLQAGALGRGHPAARTHLPRRQGRSPGADDRNGQPVQPYIPAVL